MQSISKLHLLCVVNRNVSCILAEFINIATAKMKLNECSVQVSMVDSTTRFKFVSTVSIDWASR